MERSTIVRVHEGLHARPATRFVRLAKSFESNVEIAKGEKSVSAKSPVKLMLLGVKENDEVTVKADGADAIEAVEALIGYLENPRSGLEEDEAAKPDSGQEKPASPQAEGSQAASAAATASSGDLRGIATRIADERVLQQSWLMPGSMAGRGAPPPAKARPPSVTVTEAGKPPVTGTLGRIDDFVVSLTTPDGEYRSFRITPRLKVEVADPLSPHKDLLRKYTDADIHNVTAFLATLK